MASNFYVNSKSKGGSVKFDKRSLRKTMSLQETTTLRMRDELKDIQRESSFVSLSDRELDTVILEFSKYPIFTTMNTRLGIVAYSILKNFNQFSEREIGDKIVSLESEIHKVFGITEDVNKMKMKEDIMIYCRYIDYVKNSLDEDVYESGSEIDESDYESD